MPTSPDSRPRPLKTVDLKGELIAAPAFVGQSAEAPFQPEISSSQEDVANHAYRIAKARNNPIFFSFNRSIFKVEIGKNGIPEYFLVEADSNSAEMVDIYLENFNDWGKTVSDSKE